MEQTKSKPLIFSWALYDLANQFFALNIVSLYFPRWLIVEKNFPEISYSLAFGASMFLIAVCAPFLGTISDIGGRRRTFLVFFTIISVVCTMGLFLPISVYMALLLFAVANFGCQGAIIFYNALMVQVAPKKHIGIVSGVGRMFGYTGAIVALILTKPILMKMGYRFTFLFTGILFLLFALPCMIFITERVPEKKSILFLLSHGKQQFFEIINRMKSALFEEDKTGRLKIFMVSSFFILCVVNTVILFMGVYADKVFGLKDPDITNLIAFATIFAIIGSITSGVIGDKIGYWKTLAGIYVLWLGCILCAGFLDLPFHWLVGALGGLALGATWVILRAMVVKMVPENEIGMAFGMFNLVSYSSAVVGPLVWGLVLLLFSNMGDKGYRLSFLSLTIFLVIGFVFLLRIKRENKG